MYIPIEVLSDDDGRQLEAAQSDLVEFGLKSSPVLLANHIYNTAVFSQILRTRLYPILKPAGEYGIYQTWR